MTTITPGHKLKLYEGIHAFASLEYSDCLSTVTEQVNQLTSVSWCQVPDLCHCIKHLQMAYWVVLFKNVSQELAVICL